MTRITELAAIGVAVMFASPVFAECVEPADIGAPPDGSTATEQEMVDGQQAVKSWMAEMESYLQCLEAELAALGEEATDEQRAANNALYNAAVDEMQAVAANFNEQIRAYKAAN